jgi:hypothetical protein
MTETEKRIKEIANGLSPLRQVTDSQKRFELLKDECRRTFTRENPSLVDEQFWKSSPMSVFKIKKYELMPNRVKPEDTRSGGYHQKYGDDCWELDAVEPRELQRIVREAVREELDLEVWKASLEQEEMDRADLTERFGKATVKV